MNDDDKYKLLEEWIGKQKIQINKEKSQDIVKKVKEDSLSLILIRINNTSWDDVYNWLIEQSRPSKNDNMVGVAALKVAYQSAKQKMWNINKKASK